MLKNIILTTILVAFYMNSSAQVTFYVDQNYGGPGMGYSAPTQDPCMCLTKRESGWLQQQFQCPGRAVRNDEVTSIRVAPGWAVTCYWDCNYGGESITYTSDVANVGPHWNDQISSFKIYRTTPAPPPNQEPGRLSFQNNTSVTLYFYYAVTQPGAVVNVCSTRRYAVLSPNGGTATISWQAGMILSYHFFTVDNPCDGRYEKFYGGSIAENARGGLIPIN